MMFPLHGASRALGAVPAASAAFTTQAGAAVLCLHLTLLLDVGVLARGEAPSRGLAQAAEHRILCKGWTAEA